MGQVLAALAAVLVFLTVGTAVPARAASYRKVTSAVGLTVQYRNYEWRTCYGDEPVDYTGVAHNDAGWWYCKNGLVDFGYTGIQPNDAGWWRIVDGKVDFSCNSIEHNDAGWWKCHNGQVDFHYTGVWYNAAGWWYCKNGKVDFDYTGVQYNEAGWWRIEHGKVNFSFNGLASNDAGTWYLKNGKVDFSYNGRYTWNGRTYTIRNGKAEIPVSYIPPEATATVNPNALLTLPAIVKSGAAYLGIPYRSPGYGYDIYGGSTPVKLSRDKIAGLDCSGFVYSVLMDLGVRTAGFSSNYYVPAGTSQWCNPATGAPTGSPLSMSYNGQSTAIQVLYQARPLSTAAYYYTDATGTKRIPAGTIIVGNNTGKSSHIWFYLGQFSTKEDVIQYLIRLGYARSAVEPYVKQAGSGTDWKMEATVNNSGVLYNGVNINNAGLYSNAYETLTAFRVCQ